MSSPVFSANYLEARAHFLSTANQCGAVVRSLVHPLSGALGEPLAMDVAIHGAIDAPRVLMTTSAVHGIEGFCGSAIQAGLLQELSLPSDVAVVHVHAVNPYGFSHVRRVNEDNVDLNRNFINFEVPLPHNEDYAQIHAQLIPPNWPPTEIQNTMLKSQCQLWGERRMQRAITSGQYQFSEGVWFGGLKPTWSHINFRHVLRNDLRHATQIAWIDLHTGLGPYGYGERIFACTDNGETLERARLWWGEDITSVHNGTSKSVPLSGPIQMAIYEECPAAQYTGICLEFGTLPLTEMILAMRADHWLALHPEAPKALQSLIRQNMIEAFNPASIAWQEQVWQQGRQAAQQAINGLTASH